MSTYRITGMTDLKLLKKNGAAVQKIDVHFAKTLDFQPQEKTIEYEGDDQIVKKFVMTGLDINVEADSWDRDAVESATGIVPVTTVPGVAKRSYFGTNKDKSGVKCGLEGTILAEDTDTGENVTIQVVAPVGTLSLINPPSGRNRDKSGLTLKFSAEQTAKDIAGTALAECPAEGCFWYIDELAPAV